MGSRAWKQQLYWYRWEAASLAINRFKIQIQFGDLIGEKMDIKTNFNPNISLMRRFSMKRNILLACAALALTLAVGIAWFQIASADGGLVRTIFPSAEDPGPPLYTNIDILPPHLYEQDGEWAAIFFFRDPSCVPAEFNLLDYFDFQNAFGCPLTMDGFTLWAGEPFVGAPIQVSASGLGAVPVWFAPFETINQAIQDGVLKIGELAELPGLLVGNADQFNLMFHPQMGNPIPKTILNAYGQLEDGRQFVLHATEGGDPFELKVIKIEFK
jgi:hypothetical protein